MRRYWIVVLMAVMMMAVGLVSPVGQSAGAQEASGMKLAFVPGGALDGALPPLVEQANHNLCGIGLGGYCPGRVRSCIRSGRPKAECEAWGERCDACNRAMVECRQKVGHVPGATCAPCRAALDKCRAALSVSPK